MYRGRAKEECCFWKRLRGKGTHMIQASGVDVARDTHGGDEMLYAWTVPLEESQNCRSGQRSGDKWRRGHQVCQTLSCKTNYCTNIIKSKTKRVQKKEGSNKAIPTPLYARREEIQKPKTKRSNFRNFVCPQLSEVAFSMFQSSPILQSSLSLSHLQCPPCLNF